MYALCFAMELRATLHLFHFVNSGIHLAIPVYMGISLSIHAALLVTFLVHRRRPGLVLQCADSQAFPSQLCSVQDPNKSITLKISVTLQAHGTLQPLRQFISLVVMRSK